MIIARSIEIPRPPQTVFDFVADPRNDPRWCPKVLSVEPAGGPSAGPGALFDVVHKPVPLRPARTMRHTLVEWDPPHRILWREEEDEALILVTYELEPSASGTRFTQHDDADLATPKLLHPFMRVGIGADLAKQLRHLRALLESS